MYTLNIKYDDNSYGIRTIKLSHLKKFLTKNNYEKPYKPIEKYLVKFVLQDIYSKTIYNRNIINFEIK